MAELDRILAEADDTRQQMLGMIRTSDGQVARDVVRLRTRLTALIAEMTGSIKADSRLQAKPDVAREFEAKFFEMRQTQAQHHGKWRGANIDQDPANYRRESEEVGRKHGDFYNWAKNTLSGL